MFGYVLGRSIIQDLGGDIELELFNCVEFSQF